MQKMIFNCFMAFILLSCSGYNGDVADELSGGYTFRAEGSSSYIMADNGFKEEIYENILAYTFNKDFILIKQQPSFEKYKRRLASTLNSKASSFANINSSFFSESDVRLVKSQLSKDSTFYKYIIKNISTKNTNKDHLFCLKIADSILKYDPYYLDIFSREINYWIISHRESTTIEDVVFSKIYGPFSKDEFNKKKAQLGVQQELKL